MKYLFTATLVASVAIASPILANPVVGGTITAPDRPLSKLPTPGTKPPKQLLGDLIVRKAESRLYPSAAVGLPSPKVQLQVSYCAKNAGLVQVPGPLRVKFYWDGIGAFSVSPSVPGLQGSLFEQSSAGLAGGAEWCGVMKLNFDSAASLQQLGVLNKNPTLGVWAQGNNEGANASNNVSNNTKAVTHVGAF